MLDGRTSEIQAALDKLLRDHGVQLFVLFVDTTEGLTATDFADETARLSSLGGDDALLLVAVEDRSDAIWISEALALRLTDPELNDVITGTLEPELRAITRRPSWRRRKRSGRRPRRPAAGRVAAGRVAAARAEAASRPSTSAPSPARSGRSSP